MNVGDGIFGMVYQNLCPVAQRVALLTTDFELPFNNGGIDRPEDSVQSILGLCQRDYIALTRCEQGVNLLRILMVRDNDKGEFRLVFSNNL